MTCQDFQTLITSAATRPLAAFTLAERMALRRHCDQCETCFARIAALFEYGVRTGQVKPETIERAAARAAADDMAAMIDREA